MDGVEFWIALLERIGRIYIYVKYRFISVMVEPHAVKCPQR